MYWFLWNVGGDVWYYIMMRLRLNVRLVGWFMAVLVMVSACGTMGFAQSAKQREMESPERVAQDLFQLMNQARLERGLKALEPDSLLEFVALGHSQKMTAEKKLSHYFSDYKTLPVRMREAGIYFISHGENVAYSQTYVAKIVHQELMNSPQHRDNILDPGFTHCGIAAVKRGEEYYITQDFARTFSPLEADSAEERLVVGLQEWFFKEYKYPLISMGDMQVATREMCLGKLAGKDLNGFVATAPEEWGKFRLLSILSPDLDEILEEIKKETTRVRVNSLSLGVQLGRNDEYPGGAYAVTVLFFGDKYFELSVSELAGIVIGEVNSIRDTLGLKSMKLDEKLSDMALGIARKRYFSSSDDASAFGDLNANAAMIYQTDNLSRLPRNAEDFILLKDFKEIGVGVFYPLKYRMTGNYFIVTLISN